MDFSEEKGKLYFFKYPVAGGSDFLPVATTRPETILGDTAVAVNPNDEVRGRGWGGRGASWWRQGLVAVVVFTASSVER